MRKSLSTKQNTFNGSFGRQLFQKVAREPSQIMDESAEWLFTQLAANLSV